MSCMLQHCHSNCLTTFRIGTIYTRIQLFFQRAWTVTSTKWWLGWLSKTSLADRQHWIGSKAHGLRCVEIATRRLDTVLEGVPHRPLPFWMRSYGTQWGTDTTTLDWTHIGWSWRYTPWCLQTFHSRNCFCGGSFPIPSAGCKLSDNWCNFRDGFLDTNKCTPNMATKMLCFPERGALSPSKILHQSQGLFSHVSPSKKPCEYHHSVRWKLWQRSMEKPGQLPVRVTHALVDPAIQQRCQVFKPECRHKSFSRVATKVAIQWRRVTKSLWCSLERQAWLTSRPDQHQGDETSSVRANTASSEEDGWQMCKGSHRGSEGAILPAATVVRWHICWWGLHKQDYAHHKHGWRTANLSTCL